MQRPTLPEEEIPTGDGDVTELTSFNLIRPPPFVFVERSLLDPSLKNAPGKIVIDEMGNLLLKYLTFKGIVADQIANYDQFILRQIPQIIDSRKIKIGENRFARFFNPHIDLPRELNESVISNIILPRMAREQKMTYSFTLYADLAEFDKEGRPYNKPYSRNVTLGEIPVMLGSVADHLRVRKMNGKQLLQVGECIQDPFGYFIIRGIERIILIQEKLRGNRILIFNDSDGDPNCQLTSVSTKGSTVVNIYQDKDGSFRLFYSLLAIERTKTPDENRRRETKNKGVKTIGVLEMIRLLGREYDKRAGNDGLELNNLEKITNYILSYVREEWKKHVLIELMPSWVAAAGIGDDYRNIYSKSTIKKRWDRRVENAKRTNKLIDAQENPDNQWINTKTEILKGTLDRLFSHIGYDESIDLEDMLDPIKSKSLNGAILPKIKLLSMMIAKFSEHIAGLRPIDDRDNWENKRLKTGGAMVGQLFRQLWNDMIDETISKIEAKKKKRPNTEITVANIEMMVNHASITSGLKKSFVPNNWGAPKTKTKFRRKQQNITDTLDRGQSILALQSHLTRINTPTDRKDKNPNVRAIQVSQLGYIDVVDTPSGGAVGLVKFKALTCWISVARSTNVLLDRITNFVSVKQQNERPNMFVINGYPGGWCNARRLREKVLVLRRNLTIDFDITVAIDYNVLYIYTDGSRPTRPLLIVGENGTPLIADRNMWESDFKTLLAEGVVEYVDPWENRLHNVIGPSFQCLIFYRENLARNKSLLSQYQAQLPNLEQELVLHQRPPNVSQEAIDMKRKTMQRRAVSSAVARQFILGSDDTPEQFVLQSDNIEEWIVASNNLIQLQDQIGAVELNIWRLEKKRYTHVEMDPTSVLGVTASAIPHIGNNPGPRNNFQCSMFRQAIGINTSNPAGSYPTTDKFLAYPTRPLSGTQMQKFLGLEDLPAGNNIIIAVLTTGTNEEDAITVKKEALERGLFTYTVLHSYNIVLQNTVGASETGTTKKIMDFLVKPVKPFPRHTADNYANLNERGIGMVDTLAIPGDCLVGVTRVTMIKTGTTEIMEYEDVSIYLKAYEEGVIDSVLVAKTPEKDLSVTVRIRSVGRPIIGDKLSLRSAQKSVIGAVVPERFLPFTNKGIVPDIILNSHALPKRMTMSTLIEIVTSKYAAEAGERINSTAFRTFELDAFGELLETIYGYSRLGTEMMRNPISGEIIPAEIMIGPSYYQLLKHQVQQKHQARSTGPRNRITGAAAKGRSMQGGIRFGEMERDSVIAHGAAHFLQERLFSGKFKTAFCVKCEMISVGKLMEETIKCSHCDSQELLSCTIPGSFKSLMNNIAAMGINITAQLREKVESVVQKAKRRAGAKRRAEEEEEVTEELPLDQSGEEFDEYAQLEHARQFE
uniref:DNA-directed RNA polymerase n=1 Tax=Pithovirus LCPAC201 TaxID=2506591 RepID=A0A481Z767_9VIRU|nr:MAG: DNA-directed RNA polymerase subunit beta [Pithovirus LCPAC201]